MVRAWEPWVVAFESQASMFCVFLRCFRLGFFMGHHPAAWYARRREAADNPRRFSFIATRTCARCVVYTGYFLVVVSAFVLVALGAANVAP